MATAPLTLPMPMPMLRRAARTVMVVDLVESVRLIEQSEEDTVQRWQAFVSDAEVGPMPQHEARLVKRLGDGLMLEFGNARQAVRCASEFHQLIVRQNKGHAEEQCLRLRIGLHLTDLIADDHDIYGSGVNLAARIATLGKPGETVLSAEVRDQLVLGLDAEVEDIGECYLKHVAAPVQAFKLRSAGEPLPQSASVDSLQPTLAIIPFEGRLVPSAHEVVGELLADNIIARLSRSSSLRVISRLSTSLLQGRAGLATDAGTVLRANFVMSGSYRMIGQQVILTVEVADTKTTEVMWADALRCDLDSILNGEDAISEAVCASTMLAIAQGGFGRARTGALTTLDGFSLQLAGIGLMHRSSRADFVRGREALEHLVDRYPRAPEPRAWLAKWYVLRVTLGLVENLSEETGRALEQTRRALDASPDCSLALAMEGFVHCHMLRDLDGADRLLDQALEINPNESLAWLYKCVVQGFRNEGAAAMVSAERAILLSPLDPLRHYYDGLAASAALAVGNLGRAIELATRSLQVNRSHVPTLRALAIAQVESGGVDDARVTVARILELEPALTVKDYVARGPKGAEATRLRYAVALGEAGVPVG